MTAPPVPDVSSTAPTEVRLWVALDVHKLSIVAAMLPPAGGHAGAARGSRRRRDGDPPASSRDSAVREGLAVCYEAGPGGYALWRLLAGLGVACDIVAPSLVPVRAGDRVKTDRRDAKKLVTLHRGGAAALRAAADAGDRGAQGPAALPRRSALRAHRGPPSRRQAAAQARPRVPRGQEGLDANAPRVGRAPAPRRPARPARARADARPPRRASTASSPRSTRDLEQIAAARALGAGRSSALTAFRGISTLTALGLIAEIGDFAPLQRTRASSPPGSGSPPANTPPATSSTAATSPRPATATPADC